MWCVCGVCGVLCGVCVWCVCVVCGVWCVVCVCVVCGVLCVCVCVCDVETKRHLGNVSDLSVGKAQSESGLQLCDKYKTSCLLRFLSFCPRVGEAVLT